MDSNISIIVGFFREKGLSDAQIAGVLGNMKVESNFSPTIQNYGEGAIGLCQWEGGRRTALRAFAARNGGTESDIRMQLGYLWHELQTSEHGAYEALLNAHTAADAASVWDTQFERSSGSTHQLRIDNAEGFAQELSNGGIPTSSDVHIPVDTSVGSSTQVADGSNAFDMPAGRTVAELQQQYDRDLLSWDKALGVDLQTGQPLREGEVPKIDHQHPSQADLLNVENTLLHPDQTLGGSLGNPLGTGGSQDPLGAESGSLHDDGSHGSAWDVGHH